MLTKKQYELLQYIDGYLKDNGVSPSYDEMKDALGLQSKSGIHRLINRSIASVMRNFGMRPGVAPGVSIMRSAGSRSVVYSLSII